MPPKAAKGKGKGASDAAPSSMAMWIGRARAAGALLGFGLAFYVCRNQGFGMTDAALRGLLGAVAMSLVAWWSALMVITGLMRAAAAQQQRELEAAAAEAAAAGQAAEAAFRRRRDAIDGEGTDS
jgi:hypothetical protein